VVENQIQTKQKNQLLQVKKEDQQVNLKQKKQLPSPLEMMDLMMYLIQMMKKAHPLKILLVMKQQKN
jgi:hypothetical protein